MRWRKDVCAVVDSGYLGINNLQPNSRIPIKRSARRPLTEKDRRINRSIASERALNENVIACVKRFKILSDRYRNRRKRFGLRFNLIAGIYNCEIGGNNGDFIEGKKCGIGP